MTALCSVGGVTAAQAAVKRADLVVSGVAYGHPGDPFETYDVGKATFFLKAPSAIVSAQSPSGARLDFAVNNLEWAVLPDGTVTGSGFPQATLSGLPVTSISDMKLRDSTLSAKVVAAAPAGFAVAGGAAVPSAPPVEFRTIGGTAATASDVPAFKLGPTDMEIGGVEVENATMTYDGANGWLVTDDHRSPTLIASAGRVGHDPARDDRRP